MDDLARHRAELDAVGALTEGIAAAGAPDWASRLRGEPPDAAGDGLLPADWREAWDWAAAARYLDDIDGQATLRALADERLEHDDALRRTFEGLVRDRTFYALSRNMTGKVKAALMMFATALRRTGKGTGKGAARHRREARDAMAMCYDAIPCWIMPSWRVSEQLPGRLGAFDLIVMDEASQSDIRELPALLRGKKILVVGDDKQVSPTAAFIETAKLDRLEHGFLKDMPFRTLLLPGSSLYDLAKVMFPDRLVMLKEHFRCVEPIIRFSVPFYPEPLIPLRIPTAQERLDPPLIDIYVPDGRREGDKLNPREARVVVDEIKALVADPAIARIPGAERWRSIGVVSLIGAKQAALINKMLVDELGEEAMLRHRIACGDSATFQGNERDVVFLSMVADPTVKAAQTAMHFEQRFNVALSRARDRLVLVRSIREEELNPNDLKARVIRHFREPMAGAGAPSADLEAACESDFERTLLRRLTKRGYRVRPQVGALGFRIDLVVEGADDRRLAIECDGDRYHGPERWADDMRRQRTLERVGWRFWRLWASSFALDPDGCEAELVAALGRLGIEPMGADAPARLYTRHRTPAPAGSSAPPAREAPARNGAGIRIGDRAAVRFLDEDKVVTLTLDGARHDPANGLVGATTPLGRALIGLSDEDEGAYVEDGRERRFLVMRVETSGSSRPS
jgi:very-short-patch-repair endonuclease